MSVGELQAAIELAPGHRLHRYELLCRVTAGGMANIWIARPWDGHGSDRLVVLKTILPRFAADPHFQEMFLREGGIAARITHRNVARVFDAGEANGILYIAMEYVEGDSLSKLLRECRRQSADIPPGVALRVLSDVCAGLHHAHELRDGTGRLLNVVHRDVTPQNILVGAKGIAKIIDFGIASTHLAPNDDTDHGVVKGKAHFMSPEQALGAAIDRRADVWAVGAVLYHLLAGRPPYDAPEYVETLRLITSGDPPPPLPASVPAGVAAVVQKALAYAPADRYQTAEELLTAIGDATHAARLGTSAAAVAAFFAPLAAQRAEKRRQTIELALATAAEMASAQGRGAQHGGAPTGSHAVRAAAPSAPSVHSAPTVPALPSVPALAPASSRALSRPHRIKVAAVAAIVVAMGLVLCVLLTMWRSG